MRLFTIRCEAAAISRCPRYWSFSSGVSVRTLQLPYVADLYAYRRRKTRTVMVGDVGVGGDNPIRVQSMTTTLTKDIEATVAQAERLVQAGCEIVRITTPTPADARCLGPIREGLAQRGIRVPLVADIHFNPLAAMAAADFADKVRVNPGNYVDSRKFAIREYTDAQYEEELERIEARFAPLVLKCKERGIAMRIGTNHGSLSDRVMNRFGDTPEGMVESALEFVRICEKYDYQDIILSMKASNPKVMIAAYRLLAARMARLGMEYPFHLGVTEAGNAEDGRIKSAIGIGSLLEDGIGDTIRVSLTEEPEAEVPVAFAIAGRYVGCPEGRNDRDGDDAPWDYYHFGRRSSSRGDDWRGVDRTRSYGRRDRHRRRAAVEAVVCHGTHSPLGQSRRATSAQARCSLTDARKSRRPRNAAACVRTPGEMAPGEARSPGREPPRRSTDWCVGICGRPRGRSRSDPGSRCHHGRGGVRHIPGSR